MWTNTNAASAQDPAPRVPAPPPPAVGQNTSAARTFGWFWLCYASVAWLFGAQTLPRIGYEARLDELYLSTTFGILAAIGLMFCVRAVRLDRRVVVAWLALAGNASFLAFAVVRLVRWL